MQLMGRGVEQARDRRVGVFDHTVLADHQDAFGGVIQHRGIEGARGFQVMAQALQRPAIALVLQQRLDLGLEDMRVEGFEQVVDGAAGVAFQHGGWGLRVGTQEDDRRHPRTLAAAHQTGDFKAVHAGHLDVQQHQVDVMHQQQFEGFQAGAGGDHLPVFALQKCAHAEQVFRVVIDHQKNRTAIAGVWSAFHAASLP